MANKDAPFGFKLVGRLGSSVQNNGTTEYEIASGATGSIFSGDPVRMTAAGTIQPSKIVVLGAGVAGLQAIATAKRFKIPIVALGLGEKDFDITASNIQQLLQDSIAKPVEEITFGDVFKVQTDIMTGVLNEAEGETAQFFDWFLTTSQKANKTGDDMLTQLMQQLELLKEQEKELDTTGAALEKYEALLLSSKQKLAEDNEKLAEKITVQSAVKAGLTELTEAKQKSAKDFLAKKRARNFLVFILYLNAFGIFLLLNSFTAHLLNFIVNPEFSYPV